MTPEEFVLAIKTAVFDAAVSDTTAKLDHGPPGRAPQPEVTKLRRWYSELSAASQQMVIECVRDAAHAAVFGMLCVLDGVRVIDDPPHVTLSLTATDGQGRTSTLAAGDQPFELHDQFNGLVPPVR